MSKILSMLGIKKNEEDNVPEMILNKDDPAPYYDKELKVWMIPGQEEEIKKMLAEQKKPPPIGKSKKAENAPNEAKTGADNADNSLVNPRKQIPLSKKPGVKVPSNRYASILPESSIDNTVKESENSKKEDEVHAGDLNRDQDIINKNATERGNFSMFNPAKNVIEVNDNDINSDRKQNEPMQMHENVKENTMEQIDQQGNEMKELDFNNQTSVQNKNQENNTLYYSVNNTLNLKNLEATNVDYNQNTINNSTLMHINNHKIINIDEIIEEKKKHLEQEIRKTIEAEFFTTQSELREKHQEELQELNNEYIYMEEMLNNDKAILKQNLNKYIEENISNKLKLEELSDDLKLKDKEIEQLKNVIELYKKSQQEQLDNISNSINLSTNETEANNETKNNSDYAFDRYNELEAENISLIHEVFKLKKEIANLSLEKSFVEFTAKDQEKISKANFDSLFSKKYDLEKQLKESRSEIDALVKKTNSYEKELYKMSEISKLNENLKLNLINLENQLGNSKKTNQANLNVIAELRDEINQKNEQIKEIENDMLEKMNYSSTKILNYEKELKNLNSQKLELTNKLQDSLARQENIKKNEKEIYDLNYKIFNYENELKNKLEENERVRLFIRENVSAYFSNEIKERNKDIVEILENINDYDKNINLTFDQLICLVFKNFQNYIKDLKHKTKEQEHSLNILTEDNSSIGKTLDLTNKLNLSLKHETENSKEKLTHLEKSNTKLISDLSLRQNEIQELKQQNSNLFSELNSIKSTKLVDSGEVESLNQLITKQNEELAESEAKLAELNQSIKGLSEENFELKFSNDKIKDENESMLSIFNLIKSDLNSFLNELPVTQFNSEMQKHNKDIELNETKIETQVFCKIKILKNLIENLENEIDFISKQTEILKSELERNNNLLAIKNKETEIISKQNKDLHQSLNEPSSKENELHQKILKLEKELEDKSKEMHELLRTQTGTASAKVEKLNKMLDESSKTAEIKINELKAEYESKINNLREEKTRLIRVKDDEINKLRASSENAQHQKELKGFIISESAKATMLDLMNSCKSYLMKYDIEDDLRNDAYEKDLDESHMNQCLNALKKLVERLHLDIEAKDKEILNLRRSNIAKREEQTLSKGENLSVEQQEKDVLLRTLDEKDKEINDMKQINSDMEIQISKLKTSLDESKKNHEYLLNNYKSAEKLSYLQNKVSQLSEEKAVILQTNSEAIKNLTNEINELNIQLNDYKRKELNYLNVTKNNNNNDNNLNKNNYNPLINNSEKKNSDKNLSAESPKTNENAELFFGGNKSIKLQEDKLQAAIKKNLFESDEDLKEAKGKGVVRNEINRDSRANSESTGNSPNPNNDSAAKNSQGKTNQGFFTRFIAPIFLTENELNSLNQD